MVFLLITHIHGVGTWLSLGERCVRDAEVAGSNPVVPTKTLPVVLLIIPFCVFHISSAQDCISKALISDSDLFMPGSIDR